MAQCSSCGNNVPPGFRFCHVCGSDVAATAPASMTLPSDRTLPLFSTGQIPFKQLLIAAATGLFVYWLALLPLAGFEPPFEWWEPVGMILLCFGAIVVMYFPAGYWLHGEWPLRGLAIAWFGERTSPKRHLFATGLGGLLLYLIVFLPPLDRDPVFANWQEAAWTVVHFLASFLLIYLLAGRWLQGRWPLGLDRLAVPLTAGKGSFRQLGPRQKHLLLAGASGFTLCLILFFWGGFEISLARGARYWIWTWLVLSGIAWFPIGQRIYGELPLPAPLRAFLGDERSLRRRLLLASLFTALFYLGLLQTDMAANNRILSGALYFLLMFHLMGFNTNWELTGNEAHHVLDRLSGAVDEVRRELCQRLDERQIAGLTIDEATVDERDIYSLSRISSPARRTRQLQITQGRARVIVRVLPYGQDLYVRWESYFDLSGRRIWLLFGFFLSLINGFLNRWAGSDLHKIFEYVRDIVLPWRGQDSTGARNRPLVPYESFGMFEALPSYLLDNLYALEETTHQSALEVLNTAALSAGRSEKIDFSIDRSRGKKAQLF